MESDLCHRPVVVCFLCMILIASHVVHARISFEKDLSMDFDFPPRIERAIDDKVPQGHLRPLGFQRHTDGPISKIEGMPSPEIFYKYIDDNKPVYMVGAIANVSVEKTWEKDEYLKEKYGNINVTVTARIDYDKTGRKKKILMRFKKFLLDYLYEDWYLATTIPIEMANELTIPQCLSCGSYFERLQQAELWISSGPTSTDLHSHENHILHCLIFGRRDFTIVQSKYKSEFDFKHEYPTSASGHSTLNINRINMFKYEGVANVPWKYASVRKGDCIFIPAEYLHQVRSYGRAISYTITFAPAIHFDLKGCHGDEIKKTFRLRDANFVWTYVDGHQQLVNTRFSTESLHKILLQLLGNKNILNYHKFDHFYEQVLKLNDDRLPSLEVFHQMAPKSQDFISRKDLEKLTEMQLESMAKAFNIQHHKRMEL